MIRVFLLTTSLPFLAACGGLVVVDAKSDVGAAGSSSGGGDAAGGRGFDAGEGAGGAGGAGRVDAGVTEYCNMATGPTDAGPDVDAGTFGCMPGQICTYVGVNGEWLCQTPH